MASKYKQEVSKYTKKDAVIALCFFAYTFGIIFLSGLLSRFGSPLHSLVQEIISNALVLIPLFVILPRKGGIASIGLHREKLGAALRLGLVFSLLALILRILPGIAEGLPIAPLTTILTIFLLSVMTAFVEDTIFSGYLQTRIYGLIKNDVAAVVVVALLFALIHFPFTVGLFGASAWGGILSVSMLFWFLTHIIFNLLFRRYFSLFPVLLAHFTWNFAGNGVFAMPEGFVDFSNPLAGFVLYFNTHIFVLAVAIWAIVVWRKKSKAAK